MACSGFLSWLLRRRNDMQEARNGNREDVQTGELNPKEAEPEKYPTSEFLVSANPGVTFAAMRIYPTSLFDPSLPAHLVALRNALGITSLDKHFIAKGGYGTVYLASSGKDKFAVKVARCAYGQTEFRSEWQRRMSQEIYFLAHLKHSNIVRFYGHAWLQDPRTKTDAYLALKMEALDTDLYHVLNERALTLRNATRLFDQIGSALEYMHWNNIVHNDVKPSNIMVHPIRDLKENLDEQVAVATFKLVDFGNTKRYPKESIADLRFSNFKEMKFFGGTALYAAWEILDKMPYRPVPAENFAVGATLFHAITGTDQLNMCLALEKGFVSGSDHMVQLQLSKVFKAYLARRLGMARSPIYDAIEGLLEHDEEKRIELAQALKLWHTDPLA